MAVEMKKMVEAAEVTLHIRLWVYICRPSTATSWYQHWWDRLVDRDMLFFRGEAIRR